MGMVPLRIGMARHRTPLRGSLDHRRQGRLNGRGRRDAAAECWVAQFRTRDGYLDPEAIIFPERESALAWVTAPLHGVIPPTEIVELPWFVAATYRIRGEEAYAIASLAKVVT